MKVLRLGGVNPTTSRFLDLLAFPEIERVDYVLNESEKHYFKELMDVANFFGVEALLKKVSVSTLGMGTFRELIRKGNRVVNSSRLNKLIYSRLREFNHNDYDFIWVGDNDFDGSNYLFAAARDYFRDSLMVRSYKETRFSKKWEEIYTLKNADRLIFPSKDYEGFFEELYGIKITGFAVADLDWRYSRTAQWVRNLQVKKLSSQDTIPHVCILTGRALCDPSEKRSGYRYYFVPIIEELVKRGIHVHLHALRIVESVSEVRNPYKEISERTGLLSIEGPLKLAGGSSDYEILKRYDAGILHPPVPNEKADLKRFQEINVPNRIFEYQMSDILPISEKNSNPAVDKIISETGFGIVFESYDELSDTLHKFASSRTTNEFDTTKQKTFRDFSEVLIGSVS